MGTGDIIRHRGLAKDIEQQNSFETQQGQYGISMEADLFLLADGHIAVIHNKDIDRTQEEIESMTLQDIEKLRVPGSNGESMIPLSTELIFNSFDRGNDLLMEIKASSPEKAEALVRAFIGELSQMKHDGIFDGHPEYADTHIGLHSFSAEALEAARSALSEEGLHLQTGLLWPSAHERAHEMAISETALERVGYTEGSTMNWNTAGVDLAKKLGCHSVNLFHAVITSEVVDYAHAQGLKVYAWVVNKPEEVERLLGIGVDKIISETE